MVAGVIGLVSLPADLATWGKLLTPAWGAVLWGSLALLGLGLVVSPWLVARTHTWRRLMRALESFFLWVPPQTRGLLGWVREHRPVLAVVGLTLLVAVAVGVWILVRAGPHPCGTATELRVFTSADKEGAIREEAADYMGDHEEEGCRTVNVNVTATPTARPVIEALRDHWRRWDEHALGKVGPQPDVWLPESSVDVEQVEQGGDREGPRISREGSVASAPLVLASTRDRLASVSASDRGRLHDLETVRTNPESSTAGLLATGALYEAAPDNDVARRRLERDVPIVGDDPRALLCPFRLTDQERWRQSAFVVPANVLTDFNERRPLGGPCARTEPPTTQAEIQPIEFHADDPVVLDHPCLLLSPREPPGDEEGRRHEDERRQASRSFCRYLQDEGQRVLKDHGFAPPNNAPPPIDPRGTLGRWRDARLPGRVLLAIDVSGSMKLPLPPTGREHRIDAAVAAAGKALRLVGGDDTMGLWAFNDAHTELERPQRATEPHRKRLQLRLEGLRPAGGTRLYDTIAAAVEQLEADSRKDAISALVILTDGEDHGSDLSEQQLRDQLDRADEENKRVRVFMISFLGGRCARLSNLTPALRGGCFEATSEGELTDVFRTVFASFGRGTE
jgi:Mg-chelatase subunit ChlD